MRAIVDSLTPLTKLTQLDLGDNVIGEENSLILAAALKNNQCLKVLRLRDSALDENGSVAVIQALTGQEALEELDISGNDITGNLSHALGPFLLDEKCYLKTLFMDDNEIGSAGATDLAHILLKSACPRLERLSLCCCEITAAGGIALAVAVSRIAAFSLLNLDGNEICSSGVELISEKLLSCNKTLGDMEDNDEDGEDDVEEIDETFADKSEEEGESLPTSELGLNLGDLKI
jgi:Ran GTPase-activating protein 1